MDYQKVGVRKFRNIYYFQASFSDRTKGATGAQLNVAAVSIGAMVTGLGISAYYCWQLLLACFAFMPALIITQV